ncbi:hypothetical protein [Actinoplanes sp. TFC3]|nr:hypothetical protein [Actinoplanes sp. TFC3]
MRSEPPDRFGAKQWKYQVPWFEIFDVPADRQGPAKIGKAMGQEIVSELT